MIYLSGRGLKAMRKVHQMVLEAFTGPRVGRECGRHMNGDPGDNRLCNLRWGTHKENSADKLRHGTDGRGERCPTRKLTAVQVREIRALVSTSTHAAIAAQFGVSRSTVSMIAARRIWAFVE
jgi:hypothetical protein